jgi:hypothetical protein
MAARQGLRLLVLAGSVLLAACYTPLIADYSLQAYQNATTLKADVAAMVEQSTDAYPSHQADVSALTLKLNEAYEFARGEPANAISAAEWALLLDPKGHLYGDFVRRWKTGAFSPQEAADMKTRLDRAFDEIICLEANKQSPTRCPAPEAS